MDAFLIETVSQAEKIAIAITDLEFKIQEVYGKLEFIDPHKQYFDGCTLFEILPELRGNRQELESILAGNLDSFKLAYFNLEIDGELHFLNIEVLPNRNRQGVITGVIHFVQDVTALGQLEQQINQNRNELILLKDQIERQNLDLLAANQELEHLSAMKSRFISAAAHELRNPLTSLNGYLEMLLDEEIGQLSEAQKQAIMIVKQSGMRLIRLTDQLLNAVRLESGRIDLVLQPHDLIDIVNDVVKEYSGQIILKSQTLSKIYHPGILRALCDENWTKNIIANLLSNASKFTPEGGHITIEVRQTLESDFLVFSIADTGIGIHESSQVDIFAPWWQSSSRDLSKNQGSGLGLYIAKSLVELNGGTIWYENRPTGGTIFYVTFPTIE